MPFTLFQPKYQKEGVLLARNARKLLHRHKDTLNEGALTELDGGIAKLEAANRAGDEKAINEASDQLDKDFSKVTPGRDDANWRENCEVLLVAIVLAIGIRAYFLQPFKIPTGSMQPTLNGIIGHPVSLDKPLPGVVSRTFSYIFQGRTYLNAVSEVEDEVIDLRPEKKARYLSYTRIVCSSGRSYLVNAAPETLVHEVDASGFGVSRRHYHAGEPIARGYIDTGDQVFVDKFTYHFRAPKRGDVFVFNTANIGGIHISEPGVKSEFYIKRLAGVPGDILKIVQPKLFINGQPAAESGFQKVMTLQDGYRGYCNNTERFRMVYLGTPSDDYEVDPKSYFALGDNSFNSSDSRVWGKVPAQNVVGRGLFVYYPFTKHWGPIH